MTGRGSNGKSDGEMDDGESGRGTAAAGAVMARGDGIDAACLYRISIPLRVPFKSDNVDKLLEEPSFDCWSVSSSTLAYCTV